MIPPASSDSGLLREHAFYDSGSLKVSLSSKFDYYQTSLNESETASTIFAVMLLFILVLLIKSFVPYIRSKTRHHREKHDAADLV